MVFSVFGIGEKSAVKYPKAVAFIISNEFCERFNYYGMRTILVLYLTRRLDYSSDTATILYHTFSCLVYFFPLIGAIIADSWLGRFRTILYLSVVYFIGTVLIAVGAIPPLQLPANIVTIIALVLIAIGTGGIKPCVSAFGGDQFKLPEQARQLAMFFSLFYFSINAGSLISTTVTPILREDVHCFGEHDCFSLAFGVPSILMLLAVVIFVVGKPLYVMKEPAGNMLVSVSKCIVGALKQRSVERKTNPRDHWLDYAEPKYGKELVADTKALLKILVLYLPLPAFWALFDQQGSRWTFQATQMVGDCFGFTIKPDQMQVVNPLLILIFIPIFDYAIYPLLAKCGLKRPLQKLTVGGLLAAVAFLLSGFVEIQLEKDFPILPSPGTGQLRIFNVVPCDYTFTTNMPGHDEFIVQGMTVFEEQEFKTEKQQFFHYEAISSGDDCPVLSGELKVQPNKAISYFMTRDENRTGLQEFEDSPEKPTTGMAVVRVLANVDAEGPLIFRAGRVNTSVSPSDIRLRSFLDGDYEVSLGGRLVSSVTLKPGGVYTLLIEGDVRRGYKMNTHIMAKPNTVHLLWQLPQYIVITAGEVMFAVTGLEFSFTQAPLSMKSVLQALWLLCVAVGNLIVVLIAEFRLFRSQAPEFFLFAGLMVVDMGIFIILAIRYKYIEPAEQK